MSWPKHQNPSSDDRTAHAPYNFVPLPEAVVTAEPLPSQDRYHPDRKTGYLKCTLTTKSPLYTRSMMCEKFYKQWGREPFYKLAESAKLERGRFFHINDLEQPCIPGSSLRGMTRALVEILAYGKVQPVTQARLIYRVVGDQSAFGNLYRDRLMEKNAHNTFTPKMKAGYMRYQKGEWSIMPAQTFVGVGDTTFARIPIDKTKSLTLSPWHHCSNAWKIWVKLGPYDFKPVRHVRIRYADVEETKAKSVPGFEEVVLVKSGHIGKKKYHVVVFPPDLTKTSIPIPRDMVNAYREQVTQEQEDLLGNEAGVLQDWQPVFYLEEEGQLVFFSHTKMMRLPYPNSPYDFVPPTLRSPEEIDLAEAIFGYVGLAVEPEAYASRVSFSDAVLVTGPEDVYLTTDPITPVVLSGPKPTAFQHYLVQTEPDLQQVGENRNGPVMKFLPAHYASTTPEQTVVRGHKLYWHKAEPVTEATIKEVDQKKLETSPRQYTRIQPVKEGVTFEFKVYFENLSDIELGALLWALDLPAGYTQKLGMGKPLGLGSVQIEAMLYMDDPAKRYENLFTNETEWHRGLLKNDTGELQLDDTTPYKRSFEDYVMGQLNQAGVSKGNRFASQERIRSLLNILSWDARPPSDETKYMDLEDFRERRVLPTPLDILRDAGALQDYSVDEKVKGTLDRKSWKKNNTVKVTLDNGAPGLLKIKKSKLKEIRSDKVVMIITKFQNGTYHLELAE